MTPSTPSPDDRLDQLEQDFQDWRETGNRRMDRLEYLVGELSDIARLHQEAFRVSQSNFDRIHTEIRGLQTESRRILDELQHRRDGHGG